MVCVRKAGTVSVGVEKKKMNNACAVYDDDVGMRLTPRGTLINIPRDKPREI